jgi:exopolyphosphatase/guanosine-5'-triphosphate,3'-diphosphate pyrophosphatase
LRLAAIDIGSNAARLLINDVFEEPQGKIAFIKVEMVRVPLRLGFDVFTHGKIADTKAGKIIKTLKAYQLLMEAYDVEHVKACGTSALRDAANANEILEKVKLETGIDIQIISGQQEASYIYENHIAENMNKDESYLYIDVGGGSTELTFFSDGKLVFKESFNIGTIRLLKNQVNETAWDKMKEFIKSKQKGFIMLPLLARAEISIKSIRFQKRKKANP